MSIGKFHDVMSIGFRCMEIESDTSASCHGGLAMGRLIKFVYRFPRTVVYANLSFVGLPPE